MAPTTFTRLRSVLATALCAASLTAFTPSVAFATPDPAGLVNDVSRTQSEMDRLTLEISALHEEVNKALVDLHDAQGTAEQARQAVKVARAQLDETQAKIEEAQAHLDEISRAAYRRSTTPTAVATLAGEEASNDSLDRQTYLRTTAEKQRAAVEELDQLRTEQANRESELRQLRNIAEERESLAVGRETDARTAIEANNARIGELTAEREQFVAERDAAQSHLDAVRETAVQTQDAQEYREADAVRKAAEDEATADTAAADEARRVAEEEAAAATKAQEAAEDAARSAEDAARSAEEAAAAAAQAEADETQRREAEEAAAAAVRAEKEATERRAAQERAEEEAAQQAAREAETRALRDAAVAAAVAAAAAIIADSQPEHATLENPYPSVTDEEADPAPIAAVQNPVVEPETEVEPEPVTPDLSTGPVVDTLEDVTEKAVEEASAIGDRATQIEAVIARAESQLGVPYAWGGGNASGPTRGIRDGGIADANGDYNKVGFDCSGLVLYAFAGAGIALPHYTGYQYNHGTKIDPSQMQRGDLIFYGPSGNHHVAIYLGDGMMLEAPNSGATVQKAPVRWSGMSPHAVRLI